MITQAKRTAVLVLAVLFITATAVGQHAAKDNKPEDSNGASVSADAQKVAIDKQTGKLRQPTAEEALELTKGMQLNESVEGLVPRSLPKGGIAVDLEGRFQTSTIVKKNADGSISTACVTNSKQAETFLKNDTSKPAPGAKAATQKPATVKNAPNASDPSTWEVK